MDRTKSVELGAHKIVPFSAKRSVVKLDEKKAVKKQERWQLIAKGAAEQSGRGVIPEVCGVCSFTEALEQAESLDVVLIPYELEEGMAGDCESDRTNRTGTVGRNIYRS